ncbi:hypothetical protein L1987_49710 [Smallanthus sonchifolius]|uniref:Uncharacterized protein n=1 Tax=Smallanthus sonchifolius TaxID=185202 RepID=A0ACB9FWF3_9ASTR|nr:hypothetical protein L1987_49710 [Smallanthus sonchifolius]
MENRLKLLILIFPKLEIMLTLKSMMNHISKSDIEVVNIDDDEVDTYGAGGNAGARKSVATPSSPYGRGKKRETGGWRRKEWSILKASSPEAKKQLLDESYHRQKGNGESGTHG